VFLSEVLNPWVIFVVVIFILQDYKKIEAFKPPLFLLENFLSSPSRPSPWEGRDIENIQQIEKSVASNEV
jgi:hypothetical protein